jgi:hypothetical protein
MHESQSQSQSFSWLQYEPPSAPVDIKMESYSDSSHSLLSPLTSPLTTPSTPHSTLPPSIPRRRSTNSLTGSKRVRPYPSLPRENRFRSEDSGKMATIPAYETWSPSGSKGGKSNQPAERRSSDGDQLSYPLNHAFAPVGGFNLHMLVILIIITSILLWVGLPIVRDTDQGPPTPI